VIDDYAEQLDEIVEDEDLSRYILCSMVTAFETNGKT
jgi:hypothetical protein